MLERPQGHRAALLLAAGASQRMGFIKALLPWGETTLLEFQLHQLQAAGAEDVVAVLGAHADKLQPLVPAEAWVRAVYNSKHREGRSTSIRCGVGSLRPGAGVVLIQSVDQPCPASILWRLFEVAEQTGAPVVIPTQGGRRGHPIVVARRLIPELLDLSEEQQGLREVVRRHALEIVEEPVDSEVILWNLNQPEEYAEARRRFFGGARETWSAPER